MSVWQKNARPRWLAREPEKIPGYQEFDEGELGVLLYRGRVNTSGLQKLRLSPEIAEAERVACDRNAPLADRRSAVAILNAAADEVEGEA